MAVADGGSGWLWSDALYLPVVASALVPGHRSVNPAEITDRLLGVIRDEAVERPARARAAGALVSVLRQRITTGKAKLSKATDQDSVMASLPRLRGLESLLTEVLALEVELSIAPVWLQSFGGRIEGARLIEHFERWWAQLAPIARDIQPGTTQGA